MQVTKKSIGKFVILGISGNLDMNNVKLVKEIFDKEVDSGVKYIAIDMSNLNYIDSSGIGSFIALMRRLKEVGGEVILLNLPQNIERIFQMTKLLAFFKVYKNEQDFLKIAGE
jgi:anti-anti-sigma factor